MATAPKFHVDRSGVADMEDPRVVGRTIHPPRNIVFFKVVGDLCGLSGWQEIADFAKYSKRYFSKYLDIFMGLPCGNTLRRFFEKLKSKVFGESFQHWASSLVEALRTSASA